MKPTSSNIAIIVGNGKSRQPIDLSALVGQGTIFGCNALYRDSKHFDYLVAIDDRMIDELQKNIDNISGTVIIPPEDERWEAPEYSPHRRRSNAGMNAMLEAIRRKHEVLYCLGFDFILAGEASLGNIYKDSKNYEPQTQSNYDDNFNRIRYLDWFANQHPSIQFVFVIPDDVETKPLEARNIIGLKISTFLQKLNN